MNKLSIKIDGRVIQAEIGKTILETAQEQAIEIPTLCYYKGLIPYGACRLCLVELKKGKRSQLVASCGYYVEEGMEIETNSLRVRKARKLLLELLLALMPDSAEIKKLARNYEVLTTRYKQKQPYCILCGLCVRYCSELKKFHCLGFVGRGTDREVAWIPLENYVKFCKDCNECYKLCPTGVFPSNFGLAHNNVISK
jgi:bidirectional [NiFe] hydrogenase diaphorase subunit